MQNKIAQSNYEKDQLSLVQRNPRRVGGAASSACALGIFSSWKGKRCIFRSERIFLPFCSERLKPLAPGDQK